MTGYIDSEIRMHTTRHARVYVLVPSLVSLNENNARVQLVYVLVVILGIVLSRIMLLASNIGYIYRDALCKRQSHLGYLACLSRYLLT